MEAFIYSANYVRIFKNVAFIGPIIRAYKLLQDFYIWKQFKAKIDEIEKYENKLLMLHP